MKLRTATALILTAAVLAGGGAWAAEGWFPDVPDDHRRIDAIRYAKTEGLFQGFPDGNMRPDDELSEGQFVKVAERLYDRYDVWTRADWAQVMYGGLPSLTDSPPPATTAAPATIPLTTAPAGSSRCGWPLGAAERTSSASQPPAQIRFLVTPCSPPVTYRIEFNGGQTLNLPFPTAASRYTTPLAWFAELTMGTVRVTEYRPGGPADGRLLAEVKIPWQSVAERPPVPTTTTTTTTAPTTTTTRGPTVTIPPQPVPEVPYDERDVVVHWFVHPGSDEEGDTPLFAAYIADPDGPIPVEPKPIDIGISVDLYTVSGENEWLKRSHTLHMYRGSNPYGGRSFEARSPRAAFPILTSNAPDDFNRGQLTVRNEPPSRENGFREDMPMHPFRTLTFQQVAPPSEARCIIPWRNPASGDLHFITECHPSEWSTWWGVRATAP